MTPQEKQHLARIVERGKAINAEVQALKWEFKELTVSAWEHCGVKPKVVKQLAKEAAWDQVRREEQRQIEESLDECRAALGLLADLPLGQAAQESVGHSVTNPLHKANGTNGDIEAAYNEQMALHTAEPVKRVRGRPKGSRNRPKAEVLADWARPPSVPDVPPPDVPEAA